MPDFGKKVTFDDARAIKQTASALLCLIDGEEVWIPQSQIDDESDVYEQGHEGNLVVSEWIAIQKGLV